MKLFNHRTTDSLFAGNVTIPGYNDTIANNTSSGGGPSIGGQPLSGIIAGPIGGAVLLAMIVAVLVIIEKRRHNPRRKSIAPPGWPGTFAEGCRQQPATANSSDEAGNKVPGKVARPN